MQKKSASYTGFAEVYDLLMKDTPYGQWADFIETVFKSQPQKPHLVCELGCGTGAMANILATRGYSVIAIDKSEDMLSRAVEKQAAANKGILFLRQDMRRFELYGTVDAVICVCDSINYLLRSKDILKTFQLVKNYLNPGGVFIFDVNTEVYFKKELANQTFTNTAKKVSYIWKNNYNASKRIHEFDIDFFVRISRGTYKRFHEQHRERAHRIKDLIQLAKQAGFCLEGIYDGYTRKAYTRNSKRACFVLINEVKY